MRCTHQTEFYFLSHGYLTSRALIINQNVVSLLGNNMNKLLSTFRFADKNVQYTRRTASRPFINSSVHNIPTFPARSSRAKQRARARNASEHNPDDLAVVLAYNPVAALYIREKSRAAFTRDWH